MYLDELADYLDANPEAKVELGPVTWKGVPVAKDGQPLPEGEELSRRLSEIDEQVGGKK